MINGTLEKQIEEILGFDRIVLWGAARGGRKAVELLKGKLNGQKLCFIDRDERKVGVDYCGCKVYPPELLDSLDENNTIIVITCADCESVENTVKQYFKGRAVVFDVAWEEDIPFALYYNEHRAEFEGACELFQDDFSRQVFQGVIQYRSWHDRDLLKSIVSDPAQEYFGEPIDIQQVKYYLDGGAYDGDSVKWFMERKGDDSFHVYAFEPNIINLSRLTQNFKDDRRVSIYPYALNDSEMDLYFDSAYYNGASSGFVCDSGKAKVRGVTIDNELENKPIDLIKLDIEGSEKKALLGARRTIATQHPMLAICVYHKRSDFFEVPTLIKELNPTYKLYLRHYSMTSFESVLYAV